MNPHRLKFLKLRCEVINEANDLILETDKMIAELKEKPRTEKHRKAQRQSL